MDTFIKQLFQTLRDTDSHISESALARRLGILQYSLNRSISSGSVKLAVFLRALTYNKAREASYFLQMRRYT